MEKSENLTNNRKTAGFTAAGAFSIMLVLIWTRYTVLIFVLQIISSLPIIGTLKPMVYPAVIAVLAVLAFPWIAKRVRGTEIMFYIVALLLILTTMLFSETSAVYIKKHLNNMLTVVLPMIFVGVCYDHNRHKNVIFYASLVGVITMFAYQLYKLSSGRVLATDNMDSAYKVLPSVMYLLYYAFEKGKMRYTLCAIMAVVSVLIYGTRGPALCILAFLAICIWINIGKIKQPVTRVFVLVITVVLLYLMMSSDVTIRVATKLSEQFTKWGFSSRIFDFFIEGEIADSNGRDILLTRSFELIRENPVLGCGLMGERARVGNYPHNLFVEMWCQYGVFLGTLLSAALIWIPVKALIQSKKDQSQFLFLMAMICMVFVKLFLSGSYLHETQLFFLIGISLSVSRKYRKQRAM